MPSPGLVLALRGATVDVAAQLPGDGNRLGASPGDVESRSSPTRDDVRVVVAVEAVGQLDPAGEVPGVDQRAVPGDIELDAASGTEAQLRGILIVLG